MHNIVYKITNLINGKIYIGVHRTKDLDDGYLGSGVLISKAIKRYGKEAFIKEILFDFNTIEEAYIMESEMVTIDFIRCSSNYNLHVGGKGGWGDNNVTKTHVFTNKGWIFKNDFDPNVHNGTAKNTIIVKDLNGNRIRISKDDPRYLSGELIPWNKGCSQLDASNRKRSKALKGIKHPKYTCNLCNREVSEHFKDRHNSKYH